jgi:hypothetical protein
VIAPELSRQRSRDPVFWAVTLTNTILAVGSAAGLLFGTATAAVGLWHRDSEVLLLGLLTLVAIVSGLYLVVGYWWAALRGTPSARPVRFWAVSAAYNAVAVAWWAGVYGGGLDPVRVAGMGWAAAVGAFSGGVQPRPGVPSAGGGGDSDGVARGVEPAAAGRQRAPALSSRQPPAYSVLRLTTLLAALCG